MATITALKLKSNRRRSKRSVAAEIEGSGGSKVSERSSDRVDPLAGDAGDTETKVGVAFAARPRLDTERLDLVDLLEVRGQRWTVPVASTLQPSLIASLSIRSTSKLTGSSDAHPQRPLHPRWSGR